jgi:hypothetical protein
MDNYLVSVRFAGIDFSCPHCQEEYIDDEDIYVDRCNRNKSGTTRKKCVCGRWFGIAYDYTGQAIGFPL